MQTFNADPRDGVPNGSVCTSCCCQPLSLQPGETNLITINYAMWSVPLGRPGIVGGFEYNIETNTDACPSSKIGGFLPPSAANLLLSTAESTDLAIDLTAGVTPAGNTFSYSIVPFSGPRKGTLAQTAEGQYTYTPNGGVTGKDYFSFTVTDAQSRTVTRHVEINIGTNVEARNNALLSLTPFVDLSTVVVDQQLQQVRFPLYMPLSCTECERYKLTIRQPAQDCDCNTFHHFMCFDITCKPCG